MRRILVVSVLLVAIGCRPVSVVPPGDDSGSIPGPEPATGETVSIAWLSTLYNGAPVRITGEWRISGAVVSSDREGNFHKTLVIDDGTAGIEVRIDVEQIFKRFMIHTRATVRLAGLWLGSYGGALRLGAEPFGDYQTQALSETQAAEHIFADNGFYGEVKPRELTFAGLLPRHISTFVAFEGVSFVDRERGLSWAEVAADSASATDRHLVDSAGDTLTVRTSRYASFASRTLPDGTGRIEGVMGFFNGNYQLVVCDAQKFTPRQDRTRGGHLPL